jgi:hypothetical protein
MPSKKKVGLASQRLGQLGVNAVERIILRDWKCRWQQVDAQNDDGVDGLILLESGGAMTGQVVYVQVKCRRIKPSHGVYAVGLDKASLNRIRNLWGHLVGSVILVHVDPDSLDARWADLRSYVRDPRPSVNVREGSCLKTAKDEVAGHCGTLHLDISALPVVTEADHFRYLGDRRHIQPAARSLYKELAAVKPATKDGTVVIFDRTGWRHITRQSRPRLRQYQSFALLGAVRPIIEAAKQSDLLDLPFQRASTPTRNVAIRAAVQFPHRQAGLVQVILRKSILGSVEQYRFLTVYEPRRKRSLVGAKATSPDKPVGSKRP